MSVKTIRILAYNPWAAQVEPAEDYLARLPSYDLTPRLPPGADDKARTMARLDCDWYGECLRCFARLPLPEGLRAEPAWVFGLAGLAGLADLCRRKPAEEIWWIVFIAQHPANLGPALAPFCGFVRSQGVRIAYYAYDEASRTMPCFGALAPHLDVLIHDEFPLGPAAAGLRPGIVTRHRSWVANLLPFQASFNPEPENKILFLGSEMGLTPHRRRQLDFLREAFPGRVVASHDHSVGVGERLGLNRYAAGFCPEGRKFSTPGMARSHTDRPFWCGCLGLAPVSENSIQGGRLDSLADDGLVYRYAHGDPEALRLACERALAADIAARRRIYDHFNTHETVGAVFSETLAAAMSRA
jgi:hypothetical protein